jgi:hypothetical protein
MRKYEAIEYIRSLGLPTVLCKEFKYNQLFEAIDYANILRDIGLDVGYRTDLKIDEAAFGNLPYKLFVTNDQIKEVFMYYGKKLTYIISECPGCADIPFQGTVNILPGKFFVAYNITPNISCRDAIENPRFAKGLRYVSMEYGKDYDNQLNTLKEYCMRAFIIDDSLMYKRIEFSLFKPFRFIFWQISEDNMRG